MLSMPIFTNWILGAGTLGGTQRTPNMLFVMVLLFEQAVIMPSQKQVACIKILLKTQQA
jgi:hypothetical protein